MLNIQIDNPDLEKNIRQIYGNNPQLISNDFLTFIKQKSIKNDIGVSIKQLDAGEGLPLTKVIKDIRSKYE